MYFSSFLPIVLMVQIASAAPVARVITRVHTAEAVTTTSTYTTGTTTISLPPVEILISDGVTYTITRYDLQAATPTTYTTVVSSDDSDNNNAASATTAATTTTSSAAANTENIAYVNTAATTSTSSFAADTGATSTSANTQATSAATTIQTSSSATTQESSSSTESTSSASSAASGSISAPTAIAYSPYTDSGGCKDASTVSTDLELILSKGISKIRVYGTDCGLYTNILPKAVDLGMTVNQGLWFTSSGIDSIDDAVTELVEYGQTSGWDVFEYITIGNEAYNSGYVTITDLISKIASVKTILQAGGYTGLVTTSEPPATFISYPSLCTDSGIDFVGINPHSYFDTEISADEAGTYVTEQQSKTSSACDNMDVVITETGYPSQGETNGKNVPSTANQGIALSSIIEATSGNVTILTTYNDYWKDPGTYGIEQYFGAVQWFK